MADAFLPADRATFELLARASKTGELRIAARGRSMWPLVREGDVAQVRLAFTPRVGDLVIADLGRGALVLHRLVAIDGARFLLKGDANLRSDGWLPRDALLGRVVALHRGGALLFDLERRRARLAAPLLARASVASGTVRLVAGPLVRLVRRVLPGRN